MTYYLDTNIFLRFLVPDNETMYRECAAVFALIEGKKIKAVSSSLVFAEIVWTLQSFYKFPRAKVAAALQIFAKSGIAFDNRTDVLHALESYEAHSVKFIDTLIASNPLLRAKKVTLVSYDKDFDKLNVQRIEPRELAALFSKRTQ